MSVVQTWRAWWGGQEEEEEEQGAENGGREDGEKVDKQKEPESSEDQPVTVSAWVKGFEDLVQSVGSYATTLTETVKTKVTETAIVGEFQRQQDQFAKSQQRQRDAAVPPWVGYNEEEQMRAQIMELSADSRNVLRDPPPGVEFPFEYKNSAPVAMATMNEDQRLKLLRFDLVPKKVSEEVFWRNYFYRVSLIKQSLQLLSLTPVDSSTPPPSPPPPPPSSPPSSSTTAGTAGTGDSEPLRIAVQDHSSTDGAGSAGSADVSTEEFASDQPFNTAAVSRETIQNELDQLGVKQPGGEDEDAWEAELQADLEGLDLVTATGDGEGGEEDWEHELQQMLELHSADSTPS